MEPHTIPRQITSFEFKLIGFLTLKQFLYIVLFCGIGVLAYLVTPIPYFNILLASIFVGIGLLFAFFKYNERGLDTWIKNVFVRFVSPSQYFYKKNNPPPLFLQNTQNADKLVVETHVDAQQKINKYLESVNPHIKQTTTHEKLPKTEPKEDDVKADEPVHNAEPSVPQVEVKPEPEEIKNVPISITTGPDDTPYLSGTVSNRKGVHLPDIMLYIKNQRGESVRMIKTNQNGAFLSYTELEDGEYTITVKDPRGVYFFDTMALHIKSGTPISPLTVSSKEVI